MHFPRFQAMHFGLNAILVSHLSRLPRFEDGAAQRRDLPEEIPWGGSRET